jgi:hypothetical protein
MFCFIKSVEVKVKTMLAGKNPAPIMFGVVCENYSWGTVIERGARPDVSVNVSVKVLGT